MEHSIVTREFTLWRGGGMFPSVFPRESKESASVVVVVPTYW